MRQHQHTDASAFVEELLQEGLRLFGLNQVDEAVECWRQVLVMMPDEPRALDYLDSAGFPVDRSSSGYDGWPEGTGRRQAPPVPATSAEADEPALFVEPPLPARQEPVPVAEEGIAVFEVPPVSHDEPWKAASRASARMQVAKRPSRVWLYALTGGLLIAVAVLGVRFLSAGGAGETVSARRAPAGPPPPASSLPAAAAKVADAPAAPVAEASAEADTYVVKLSVDPANAQIVVDGVPVARGNYIARLPRDGTRHTVEVSAEGHKPREFTFIDEAPPSRIRLSSSARETPSKRSRSRSARRDLERAVRASEPAERAPAEQPAEKSWVAPKSDNIDPWQSN